MFSAAKHMYRKHRDENIRTKMTKYFGAASNTTTDNGTEWNSENAPTSGRGMRRANHWLRRASRNNVRGFDHAGAFDRDLAMIKNDPRLRREDYLGENGKIDFDSIQDPKIRDNLGIKYYGEYQRHLMDKREQNDNMYNQENPAPGYATPAGYGPAPKESVMIAPPAPTVAPLAPEGLQSSFANVSQMLSGIQDSEGSAFDSSERAPFES